MALKKPSEFFNKKEEVISVSESIEELSNAVEINTFSEAFDAFKNNLNKIEILSDFSETFTNYKNNTDKINYISEQVNDIQLEIQNVLRKEDLDRAIMAQILIVEKTLQQLQDKIKNTNEEIFSCIREDVFELADIVNNLVESDIPNYKRIVVDNNITINSKISRLEDDINHSFDKIKIDQNQIDNELSEKINDLHCEIIRNESNIRVQNKNLKSIQEEVKDTLGKINLDEIQKQNYKLGQKVKYLEEIFEKFSEREILTEGILAEPPSTDNKDPLTPLDQKFVTIEQLQEHYRLFINRVQQQLATLGGGGETRLKYLDDIVGIATNPSAYDGKFLSYDHTNKRFEFVTVTQGGGGNVAIAITDTAPLNPQEGNLWYDKEIGRTFLYYTDEDGSQWVDANPAGTSVSIPNYWISTNAGIHTLSNVGIGTTNPTSELEVSGNIIGTTANFVGIVSTEQKPIVNIPSSVNPELTTYGILGVGKTLGFEDNAIIAHFCADVDSYGQVIIQNHNSGTAASADLVINNNQEIGVNYYIDLGINGSGYVGYDAFSDVNGGYLYVNGGSLSLGTSENYPLKIGINNNEIVRVNETGVGIGTTDPTTKFEVQGGDIRVGVNTSEGIILTSPNGTKYRLIVSDSGVLSTVLVP